MTAFDRYLPLTYRKKLSPGLMLLFMEERSTPNVPNFGRELLESAANAGATSKLAARRAGIRRMSVSCGMSFGLGLGGARPRGRAGLGRRRQFRHLAAGFIFDGEARGHQMAIRSRHDRNRRHLARHQHGFVAFADGDDGGFG